MKEGKIKITVKAYGVKQTIELNDGATIEEMFNAFKTLAIGMTYPQQLIDNYIMAMAEDLNNEGV